MSTSTLKVLLQDPTPDLKKINGSVNRLMKRPKLQKVFFKLMTKTWSEDEDSRRILALINILKALNVAPACCALSFKLMYAAYVRNCKFVLGSTIAHINFMRLSLLEVFSANLDETYLHAFAYIRQLAIELRKAYTTHAKADTQAVLNWPFVCSLQLWVDAVSKFAKQHNLISTLVHPLVQLLVGLTKLNPGERWIPLRFHCVSMLHILAGVPTLPAKSPDEKEPKRTLTGRSLNHSGRILVPSLPLLLDVFQLVNFNRRASSASKAPLDLRLLIHFSPSQRRETASLDAIVSWLCDLLTEAAATHANSLAFPEYALPIINELRHFCNTCRVASFTRQMKALLVKLREHSEWVSAHRRRVRNLANSDELAQVESSLCPTEESLSSSPFLSFYVLHKEVRSKELARLTESHQKDVVSSEVAETNGEEQRRTALDSDSEVDSDDSKESYDLDDGSSLVHISKAKKPEEEEIESSDSEFDLEAALNESEAEQEDDEQNTGENILPDQISDFALSDSEAEIVSDDEEMKPERRKRKKLKAKGKTTKKVRTTRN